MKVIRFYLRVEMYQAVYSQSAIKPAINLASDGLFGSVRRAIDGLALIGRPLDEAGRVLWPMVTSEPSVRPIEVDATGRLKDASTAQYLEAPVAAGVGGIVPTPGEHACAALFKTKIKLNHNMPPEKIVEFLKAGFIKLSDVPYGSDGNAADKTIAKFVEGVFRDLTYVEVNGQSYLAAKNHLVVTGHQDVRFMLLEMAEQVDRAVTAYIKANPGKKITRPFDLKQFATMSVDEMMREMRRFYVFDTKLKVGTPVLPRFDKDMKRDRLIMRGEAVSAWLSKPVVDQVKKMALEHKEQQKAKFLRDLRSPATSDPSRLKADTFMAVWRQGIPSRNKGFTVVQQVILDKNAVSGASQQLFMIDASSKSRRLSKTAMAQLQPGQYELQSHRGIKLGRVEVTSDGKVTFFNTAGQAHNAYGPAVQQISNGQIKEDYMIEGQPATKAQIAYKLQRIAVQAVEQAEKAPLPVPASNSAPMPSPRA